MNEIKIEGIVEVLDKLPKVSFGWMSSFNGRIAQVNGQRFTVQNVYVGEKWKTEWVKIAE